MVAFPLVGLDADGDGLHPAGPDPWWREAWYFEFYDPRAQLQFQAYQGVFPNAGMGDLTTGVFHQGRLLHQLMKMDYTVAAEPIEERLGFGPLRLEMLEPFARWRLQYDTSDLQADIHFEALHQPFSWAEAKLWMETTKDLSQRSQHFDQFGRYTGTLRAAGRAISIDTLGFRDRMWGWGGRKQWRSYVVLWAGFGEDFVANIAVQRFAEGPPQLCGYLHQDGTRALLRRARIEVEWDPQRRKSIAAIHASLEDHLGRRSDLTGRPQGILDTSHQWKHRKDHMLFSVGEYQSRGRTGFGVLNWAFPAEAEKPHLLEAQFEGEGGRR
jgi:hypothetical protein